MPWLMASWWLSVTHGKQQLTDGACGQGLDWVTWRQHLVLLLGVARTISVNINFYIHSLPPIAGFFQVATKFRSSATSMFEAIRELLVPGQGVAIRAGAPRRWGASSDEARLCLRRALLYDTELDLCILELTQYQHEASQMALFKAIRKYRNVSKQMRWYVSVLRKYHERWTNKQSMACAASNTPRSVLDGAGRGHLEWHMGHPLGDISWVTCH